MYGFGGFSGGGDGGGGFGGGGGGMGNVHKTFPCFVFLFSRGGIFLFFFIFFSFFFCRCPHNKTRDFDRDNNAQAGSELV